MKPSLLFVFVGGLMLPNVGWTQTHPCDVQQPTVYREKRQDLPTLKLGWCFAPVDTEGVPIAESIGFSLQIDGGPNIDMGIVPAFTGPNAQGEYYFVVQNAGALTAGVLTIKVYTASLGMSAASESITLTITGSPRKPRNGVIIPGSNE